MTKREKVYLKDLPLYDEIDHSASAEQFPETYARLDTLTHGSNKKLVWRCSVEGHGSWEAKINDRYTGGRCPRCSGHAVSDSNRLTVVAPNLVSEWDCAKNSISPSEVSFASRKVVWWVCYLGHSWEAQVNNRYNGSGCPECNRLSMSKRKSKPKRGKSLLDFRPDLALEFDTEMNAFSPSEVSYGSCRKVWWKCYLGHSWEAKVNNRNNGSGCPYCSGRLLSDLNRLSVLFPAIASEWDYDKNSGSPDNTPYASNTPVWWICEKGHSWLTTPNVRSRGNGCLRCYKRIHKIEKRFIETFAEQTKFTLTAHGMRLNQLKYESGRIGVEVDLTFYYNHHYLLIEYDGNYWHREKTDFDTEKSRQLLSLGDNILHARIRENDLHRLDLTHDRFAQFQHDYHAFEDDSIESTTKEIEQWFLEKIGE